MKLYKALKGHILSHNPPQARAQRSNKPNLQETESNEIILSPIMMMFASLLDENMRSGDESIENLVANSMAINKIGVIRDEGSCLIVTIDLHSPLH